MASSFEEEEVERSPLPTVNERLGHLKPSKELLEYYRRKIAEYDGEHEEMLHKLERYKCTYEEQVRFLLLLLLLLIFLVFKRSVKDRGLSIQQSHLRSTSRFNFAFLEEELRHICLKMCTCCRVIFPFRKMLIFLLGSQISLII